MVQLNMQGSYDLISKEINRVITKISAGNYALGHVEDNKFIVEYVGRSDSDFANRLQSHTSDSKYKRFKFSYADSPKEAHEKEC